MKRLNLVPLGAVVLLLGACERAPRQLSLEGLTMGTSYHINYLPGVATPEAAVIKQNIDEKLDKVNAQMSTYRDDSELSRFNLYRQTDQFVVSEDTALVMSEALRLATLSHGALDVTVGPLVNLWGFGPDKRPEKIPTDDTVTQIRERTGYHNLSVEGNLVRKAHPELYVDLSTIAKGFGVDKVANYLQSQGVENYMVEIGGEIRTKGKNAAGRGWRIAIEKPVTFERAAQRIIAPGDNGLATSGDYRNYYELNGERYSHIIDPVTAKPIKHKLVSVSVIHPSSMTADGLSTMFMVMGPEKGYELAKSRHIPALFVVKTEHGFKELQTHDFGQYIVPFVN